MHEYGLMESVLAHAAEEAHRHGARRVDALRIEVGRLTGASPEALVSAFQALSAGTICQGASLELEEVPGRLVCGSCGARGGPEEMGLEAAEDRGPWLCPGCGDRLHAVEGMGLRLASIRFLMEDDEDVRAVDRGG